jgi:hypothetical protein
MAKTILNDQDVNLILTALLTAQEEWRKSAELPDQNDRIAQQLRRQADDLHKLIQLFITEE